MRALFIFSLLCVSLIARELSWKAPVTISSLGVDSSSPSVAMDGSGNAVAAWIEKGAVVARSLQVKGAWGSPSRLSEADADSVQVVVSSSGDATVLWLEKGAVKSADLPLNGSWGSVVILAKDGSASPQLAVDASGNVIAVWVRGGNIESATKLAGGNWPDSASTIASVEAALPSVSIGSDGTAAVVWSALADAVSSVYIATAAIGQDFGSPTLLSTVGQNSGYPRVFVNARGDILAGWFRWDVYGSVCFNVICQAAIQLQGDAWGSPVDLSLPGVRVPDDVRVALDDERNAIAIWNLSIDGSTYHLQFSVKSAGRNWSLPADFMGENLAPCNVDTVLLSNGEFRIVLLNFNQSNPDYPNLNMLVATTCLGSDLAGSWSFPVALSSKGMNFNPKIASVIQGKTSYGTAVWIYFNGSNKVIHAATGTGTTLDPPKNVSVRQEMVDYKVFQEYRNRLSWEAASSVTEYRIFRNGLFAAQVFPPQTEYIDHNQTQNELVAYDVIAVDGVSVVQSSKVSVVFPDDGVVSMDGISAAWRRSTPDSIVLSTK